MKRIETSNESCSAPIKPATSPRGGRVLWAVLLAPLSLSALAALDIDHLPLVLPQPAPPNVVLSIMKDGLFAAMTSRPQDKDTETWGGGLQKAYHYNPIAYNPNIRYRLPPGEPSVSFRSARYYGYRPNEWSVQRYRREVTGSDLISNTIDLETDYRPTIRVRVPGIIDELQGVYDCGPEPYTTGDMFPVCDARPAYYFEFRHGYNTGSMTCDKNNPAHKAQRQCYQKVIVGSTDDVMPYDVDEDGDVDANDKKLNFAIWYSYYRTRELAMVSAMLLTMPKLEGKIRLAWQNDNCRLPIDGPACVYGIDNGLKQFSGAHATTFYNYLKQNIYFLDGKLRTSLADAARYLGQLNNYRDDPSNPDSVLRSCRDNIHLGIVDGGLIHTAGEAGGETSLPALPFSGDVDSTAFSATGGVGFMIDYTPQIPYLDRPGTVNRPITISTTHAHTLADYAMYYWARDIAPEVENTLVPSMTEKTGTETARKWNPRNNPATWQHIVNYFVVPGGQAALDYSDGRSDWVRDMYDSKQAKGLVNWIGIPTSGVSGGMDIYASYDMWHAALNSRGLFLPVERVDELIQALERIAERIERRLAAAAALAANSTRLDDGTTLYRARFTAVDWAGELIANRLNSDGTQGAELWQASFPAADSRKLYTRNDAGEAVAFNDSALLPADWDTQVGVTDATAAEVLAWLRGDQSREQTFDSEGALTGGKYRKRQSLLGDIVNSDPVYVGYQHYGHARLPAPEGGATYEGFVASKKNRVKMLYVGANDGMLHGFVAGSGSGAGNTCGDPLGQELFAYIPKAVRSKLPTLANPQYGQPGGVPHRYSVDGPAYVGDAYLGGAWKTVLLGTTGAGARAVFALDVTNPCDFDASKVLWERDEIWDADLGYTLAKPIIARLNNGQWAAVFGNGYNSDSGKAVLFIVKLDDGTLIRKFDLGGGPDNGLAAPSLYDANGDGITDFIYAGDLKGRLWKIDVSASSSSDWAVANSNAPLFTATGPDGQPQPITAAPELGAPPSGQSGVMVYIGTGRWFVQGDEGDRKVQTLYGLLDKGAPIGGRGDLVQQAFTQELSITVSGETKKVRKVSQNEVDYASKRGWYIDLNHPSAQGERVISTPQRRYGRILYTVIAPEADPCKFGGSSWLAELDPYTGGMPETSIIDLGDEVFAAVQSDSGMVKRYEFLGDVAIGLSSTGETGSPFRLKLPPSPSTGRISWREIID